jgi:3-dehydroquinate synthase
MKLTSRIITVDRSPIFSGVHALSSLEKVISGLKPDGIFILADPNSVKYCLPILLEKSTLPASAVILEIPEGEQAKSLENAAHLWNRLLVAGAGRSSVLINLGGGVVSDLGGFVAAGFKRGISHINIPTTLMAQADAAIGGKTAVNLGHIKNQVGFYHAPKAIIIFPGFLKTLPADHFRSGLAEIIKSVLISDAGAWHRLKAHPVKKLLQLPAGHPMWLKLVSAAVTFKNHVITVDYKEKKLRKVLNFGHTIGHALEGFSQQGPVNPLLHGDAVAAGMICAAYLSYRKAGLSPADLEEIRAYLSDGFPGFSMDPSDFPGILELMMHDKKMQHGHLQFTLISKPGSPVINRTCSPAEILEALAFYNSP